MVRVWVGVGVRDRVGFRVRVGVRGKVSQRIS